MSAICSTSKLFPMPYPVAARSKAWGCNLSLPGIAGSNPVGVWVPVCWECCFIKQRCLRWADLSSRVVVPNVVCLSVFVKPRSWGGLGPHGVVAQWKKKSAFEMLWKLVVLTVKERVSECASLSVAEKTAPVQQVRVLRMDVRPLSWRWRHHVLSQRYYQCTKLHGEGNSCSFGIFCFERAETRISLQSTRFFLC